MRSPALHERDINPCELHSITHGIELSRTKASIRVEAYRSLKTVGNLCAELVPRLQIDGWLYLAGDLRDTEVEI